MTLRCNKREKKYHNSQGLNEKKITKRTNVIIKKLHKKLEKPNFIKKKKAQFAEFIHCLKMFKISFMSKCNAHDTTNKTIIKKWS